MTATAPRPPISNHPSGYRIGAATVTTDGEHGAVCALVVDPATRIVTHLAVQPRHGHHRARLVPTAMATTEPNGDVRIACDREGLDRLDQLEQPETIDLGPYESYGLYAPYGYEGAGGVTGGMRQLVMWIDRPPEGETALRHGTLVCSGDHPVGHLDGLLAGADGRIAAVLVASGHLWARRTVAVPVEAVTEVSADRLTVAEQWDQVRRGS